MGGLEREHASKSPSKQLEYKNAAPTTSGQNKQEYRPTVLQLLRRLYEMCQLVQKEMQNLQNRALGQTW